MIERGGCMKRDSPEMQEMVDKVLSFPEDRQKFIIEYLMTCLKCMESGYGKPKKGNGDKWQKNQSSQG